MNDDERLRKWCLERAFENSDPHEEVTSVADNYYRWIKDGESEWHRREIMKVKINTGEPLL